MKALKELIKKNRKLHSILYPIVYSWRYFIHADCRTAFFFLKFFLRKLHIIPCDKHLVKLEGKYRDKRKRVFIIATGPSLRIDDLEWLKKNGEICIACNSIVDIYDLTNWRPDYFFINDDVYYINYMKENPEFRFEGLGKELSLVPEYIKKHIAYPYNPEKISFVPICYFDHWIKRPGRIQRYTNDLKFACYDLYTVTNSMIAFADFLGFKEIYLLGVDCNYYGKDMHLMQDAGNLSKEEKDVLLTDTEKNYMVGFRIAKKGCERNGVKVYNATRGGSLEVFPRVNMDDIIKSAS